MLHSSSYLTQSHKLLSLNFPWKPDVGMTVARGFADLGFEEFSVLNGGKMVSLLTGQISTITDQYKAHFFPVLSPDELVQQIYKREYDVLSLNYEEQRMWKLCVKPVRGEVELFEGVEIETVLLSALLKILEGQKNV